VKEERAWARKSQCLRNACWRWSAPPEIVIASPSTRRWRHLSARPVLLPAVAVPRGFGGLGAFWGRLGARAAPRPTGRSPPPPRSPWFGRQIGLEPVRPHGPTKVKRRSDDRVFSGTTQRFQMSLEADTTFSRYGPPCRPMAPPAGDRALAQRRCACDGLPPGRRRLLPIPLAAREPPDKTKQRSITDNHRTTDQDETPCDAELLRAGRPWRPVERTGKHRPVL